MAIDSCILLITGTIAAPLTFFVNERLRQGPVRSSAGLSLLLAGFFYFFPHILNPFLAKNIPVVFIGSSFIGMVSARLLSNYLRIGIAGLIFCVIYLNTSHFFNGYGGALGTAASISLLAVLSLPILNVKGRLTSGFSQLRKIIYTRKERY
jgi:hypothetical protein